MKTFYSILILSFASFISAHGQGYNLSVSNEIYNDLNSPTSINNGLTWDDPQFQAPIGFSFDFFGQDIVTIHNEDYGFGALLVVNGSETGTMPFFIPYGADIIDRGFDMSGDEGDPGSLSPISYKVDGTAGSRIFKLEWKNAGFYSDLDDDGISSDYVNFQVWLYEGSNDVEVRFGPNSIQRPDLAYDGETGASIAFDPAFNFTLDEPSMNIRWFDGIPTAPQLIYFADWVALNGTIPNGTVYKLSKNITNISTSIAQGSYELQVYPNPATTTLSITEKDFNKIRSIKIINTLGQTVSNHSAASSIDISALDGGVYFLEIETDKGNITKRFVKQ